MLTSVDALTFVIFFIPAAVTLAAGVAGIIITLKRRQKISRWLVVLFIASSGVAISLGAYSVLLAWAFANLS
jgi:hypothetical protein